MKKFSILAVLALVLSCNPAIKYEDDLGFLNSAQANSMEYMVRINGTVCRDVDGAVGFCAKRVRSNRALKFHHDPRPYAYRFQLRCSSAVNSDFTQDVEAGKPLLFEIPREKFEAVRSFTCIGEIYPFDRSDKKISAAWRVAVTVVDENYEEREVVYEVNEDGERHVVLGRHALHAVVCDASGCRYLNKGTVEKVHKTGSVLAFSESYMMRFNYFGY